MQKGISVHLSVVIGFLYVFPKGMFPGYPMFSIILHVLCTCHHLNDLSLLKASRQHSFHFNFKIYNISTFDLSLLKASRQHSLHFNFKIYNISTSEKPKIFRVIPLNLLINDK